MSNDDLTIQLVSDVKSTSGQVYSLPSAGQSNGIMADADYRELTKSDDESMLSRPFITNDSSTAHSTIANPLNDSPTSGTDMYILDAGDLEILDNIAMGMGMFDRVGMTGLENTAMETCNDATVITSYSNNSIMDEGMSNDTLTSVEHAPGKPTFAAYECMFTTNNLTEDTVNNALHEETRKL